MKNRTISAAVLAAVGLVTNPVPAPAAPAPGPPPPPSPAPIRALPGMTPDSGIAYYDGDLRDLSEEGWGDAQVCSVYEDGITFCFDSEAEADVHAGVYQPRASEVFQTLGTPCTNEDRWLKLYRDKGGNGRSLQFRDRGVTQNLASYGFDNQASSWGSNLYCHASGYKNANGGGPAFRYMCGAGSPNCIGTSYALCGGDFGSTWNDTLSSFRIHARA